MTPVLKALHKIGDTKSVLIFRIFAGILSFDVDFLVSISLITLVIVCTVVWVILNSVEISLSLIFCMLGCLLYLIIALSTGSFMPCVSLIKSGCSWISSKLTTLLKKLTIIFATFVLSVIIWLFSTKFICSLNFDLSVKQGFTVLQNLLLSVILPTLILL